MFVYRGAGMLPDLGISSTVVYAPFNASKFVTSVQSLVDYELGANAIGNPAGGMSAQLWTASINNFNRVVFTDENDNETISIAVPENVSKLAVAFDLNMRPAIAYSVESSTFLYWYDTAVSNFVTTEFVNCTYPAMTLDERRTEYISNSDIVLVYIHNNNLCCRLQRDRFNTEYTLLEGFNGAIATIGTNEQYRLQFLVRYNEYGVPAPEQSPTPTPAPSVTPTVTPTITPTPTIP